MRPGTNRGNQRFRAERSHSLKRLRERCDGELTKLDVAEICKIIRSGNTDNKLFLHVQSDGREHWLVRYKSDMLRVVYDKRHKITSSFLPVEPRHMKSWHEARRPRSFSTGGIRITVKRT